LFQLKQYCLPMAKSFKAKTLKDLKRKYFKIKTESDFICSNSHCLKIRKVQLQKLLLD